MFLCFSRILDSLLSIEIHKQMVIWSRMKWNLIKLRVFKFQIEAILKEKGEGVRKQYLVRWKGWQWVGYDSYVGVEGMVSFTISPETVHFSLFFCLQPLSDQCYEFHCKFVYFQNCPTLLKQWNAKKKTCSKWEASLCTLLCPSIAFLHIAPFPLLHLDRTFCPIPDLLSSSYSECLYFLFFIVEIHLSDTYRTPRSISPSKLHRPPRPFDHHSQLILIW